MNIIILGGTGTLGQALARDLIKDPENVLTILSRDELKQKEMKQAFGNPKNLHFMIGDIRDKDKMITALNSKDAVFHVAALKHIDVIEENPEESVKTNILGTMNVADAAVYNRVKFVAFSSTDKAVDPVNVYGMSKGISEKILLRRNEIQPHTLFNVYRWGNVASSRGSVIPTFARTIRDEGKAYITDMKMTRFWIRIEDAVDFMLSTYQDRSLYVRIPPIKAASVTKVIQTVANIVGRPDVQLMNVGMRRGEKLHEALTSAHDLIPMSSDNYFEFTDAELDAFLRPLVEMELSGAGN